MRNRGYPSPAFSLLSSLHAPALLTRQEALGDPGNAFVYVLAALWRRANTSLLLLASKFISLAKNGEGHTAGLVALQL